MATRLPLMPATVNAFRRALPRWYTAHKRDLPWRHTRDPYRIWVSEIMLQQTRVETVIPYYQRWMRVFPTLPSLARAPYRRVLKLWEGLGYYQRARNLHRAARQLRCLFIEQSFDEKTKWMDVPGVGRYTAGAIASIAFGARVAALDGNGIRVLARVFRITENVKLPATQRRLWALAEALLPEKRCGEFNQALMELGALVCLPSNPRCRDCPLRRVCASPTDTLPNRGPRQRAQQVRQDVLFVERAGKVLLRQRPPNGLLAGLWEFPPGRSSQPVLTLRHAITHHRITLRVFTGKTGTGQWFTRRQLSRVAMPAAHRRALEQILTRATTAPRHRGRRIHATPDTAR